MANIRWLGHASFLIQDGITIYIDPWKLKSKEPKADLVLVSHSHYDHFSAPDIEKISGNTTRVIGAADLQGKVRGNFEPARPGQTFTIGEVTVRTVPAYNTNKKFHPRENGWLGFLIDIGGETIYYSGDSDATPEMGQLGKVDVALLPVGGTYTMTADEAAKAVNEKIKPKTVIPYHWGDIVGSEADAKKFAEACQCKTDLQRPY
ncbi:MBL fold metallo-hydrolase [bacterium]|nr:MBL fold metallo-hydrolase [bacterium]